MAKQNSCKKGENMIKEMTILPFLYKIKSLPAESVYYYNEICCDLRVLAKVPLCEDGSELGKRKV